jgi:hypothetical protein
MREDGHNRPGGRAPDGFTIIEMLMVITIIMLVMGLALPNFVAMMKERKWTTAVANVQVMVWRARALATNVRKDFSVEFDIQGDNGTTMWLESEMNDLEAMPEIYWLQEQIGGYTFRDYILSPIWSPSGGTYQADPARNSYNTNFQINYANSKPQQYGDNARQSEVVELARGLTIDPAPGVSPNFLNWDVATAQRLYGVDNRKDIRIGPNGALVQSINPVICIRQIAGGEYRQFEVIRCTGRMVPAH